MKVGEESRRGRGLRVGRAWKGGMPAEQAAMATRKSPPSPLPGLARRRWSRGRANMRWRPPRRVPVGGGRHDGRRGAGDPKEVLGTEGGGGRDARRALEGAVSGSGDSNLTRVGSEQSAGSRAAGRNDSGASGGSRSMVRRSIRPPRAHHRPVTGARRPRQNMARPTVLWPTHGTRVRAARCSRSASAATGRPLWRLRRQR